jgi:hypothetical protein
MGPTSQIGESCGVPGGRAEPGALACSASRWLTWLRASQDELRQKSLIAVVSFDLARRVDVVGSAG